MILKNEAGLGANVKTPDGYLFTASFEQRTPTKNGGNTIRNALFHAKEKKADIAVIYSKNGAFTRKSVDEGIKMYEGTATSHRFKKNNRCVIFWKYPTAQAQRLKCVQSRLGTRSDYAVIQLLSNGGHRHPDPCLRQCKGSKK